MRRVVAAAFLLLLACDGFFPPGDFQPSGTQFYLNDGISVTAIAGSLSHFSPVGKYTLDMVCRATGGAAVGDTLPAGLLLRSKTNAVQHMLILKPHPFTAEPGGSTVIVGTFCCNELRQIPDYQDSFEIGPLTDNAGLRQIASLVGSKNISGALGTVQNAVYEVTSHDSLPQVYVESLSALPPGTP